MSDDSTDDSLKLRHLLFHHTDIYSDWYFFILKLLQSGSGLTLKGLELDLTDAHLEVKKPNSHFKTYLNIPSSLGVRVLKDYDISDKYLFYRSYFPAILFFPNDELSITKSSLTEINVKLICKGVERVLIEEELLNFERTKQDLLIRLGNGIRNSNLDLKKVLENLQISHPDLKDMELWDWLNKQNSFLFWEQLTDLQNMFEAYNLIVSDRSNFYYISIFDECKQEIEYLMSSLIKK